MRGRAGKMDLGRSERYRIDGRGKGNEKKRKNGKLAGTDEEVQRGTEWKGRNGGWDVGWSTMKGTLRGGEGDERKRTKEMTHLGRRRGGMK